MAILQHIQSMSDQLADSEGKVARAVLADPQLLEHYTITSLAQHSGTSTSAVLRFCHSLGFAGYKDFRFALVSELQHAERPNDENRDPLVAAAEGFALAMRQLADIDRGLVEELARQITHASAVLCVGIHRSALPAAKLRMDLEDLGIMALSCDNTTHATHVTNLVNDTTCVVIFSESGLLTSYRAALDSGLVAQGHSWIVTTARKPQLASQVQHVITLPSAKRAGAGAVDEHPIAMAFVELLGLQVREELR